MFKYSRQEKVIGTKAQKRLQKSKALIVGMGALGTVAASLLARAGIKELILIDRDVVEESNLPRQLLYTETDVGKSKAFCAKEKLEQINSQLRITALALHLNPQNIANLKEQNLSLILDCTDNLKTKLLLNDFCKKEKIPFIYGSAIKQQGQVMAIFPGGPCLSCFLKEAHAETCEQIGVLNTITSLVGTLQADLALKILIGQKQPSELYCLNLEKNSCRKLTVNTNPLCPACQGRYDYLNSTENAVFIKFCSSGKYQIDGRPLNLEELNQKLKGVVTTYFDGASLKIEKMLVFADGRALIAADSEQEAQAIYSKYVGN